MTGFGLHALGMYSTATGNSDKSWEFFMSGTVMWIGAVTVIVLFYGPPVSRRRKRR